MRKKITIFIILLALLSGATFLAYTKMETKLPDYTSTENSFVSDLYKKGIKDFVIYDSKNLTSEILESRTESNVIIERCVGKVLDENGNGKVLNAADENYDYISYRSVSEASNGNIVLTYLIYNPENNYVDDITERYDFILR